MFSNSTCRSLISHFKVVSMLEMRWQHHTISNHEFLSCAKNDFNNDNDNLLNGDGCSAAAVPLVLCSI